LILTGHRIRQVTGPASSSWIGKSKNNESPVAGLQSPVTA
jgi:hypothetical protein